MSRPRKKAPAGEASGVEPISGGRDSELQDSADSRLSPHWKVPSDDKDGFDVCIGMKGHVVLKQARPFMEEVEIIFHPDEARQLLNILPDAILAADYQRLEAN